MFAAAVTGGFDVAAAGKEDAVDEFEREIIGEALERVRFNQTRAAEKLGTTRRILKYRMDKLGIEAVEN